MARASRCDTHRLDAVEVTASGALRVPARVARVGVLMYTDGEGNRWGELVPAETLFAADSMGTLRGVAVTDLHPGALVTPVTRKGVQVGHAGDDVKRDGDYLAAPVYVTDADEIKLVQSGDRRDVSCGYTCDFDEVPGTFDGVPYARVQRDRVYNHLGLGPEGWGRAGTDVSLRMDAAHAAAARFDSPVARLDSQDQQTVAQGASAKGNDVKKKLKVRGREYNLDADDEVKGAQGAVDAMEAESVPKKDADAQAAMQSAKLASMEALIGQLTKEIAELKSTIAAEESAEVAEADVPEVVADSIVVKRLALLDAARADARLVAPAVKLETVRADGKSVPMLKPRDIHAAALALVLPSVKTDGLSDDNVAGMFGGFVEAAKAKVAKRTDGARKGSEVLTPSAEQAEDVRNERSDAADFDPIAEQQAALKSWSRPSINSTAANTSGKN